VQGASSVAPADLRSALLEPPSTLQETSSSAPADSPSKEAEAISFEDDDTEVPCTIRFALPPAMHAAFEDARDLHDAVTGGHGTVATFIEALIAEAYAGPSPPEEDPRWFRRRLDVTTREGMLARASENWKWLHDLSGPR